MKNSYIISLMILFFVIIASYFIYLRTDATPNEARYAQVFDHLDGIVLNPRFLGIPTYDGSGQIAHPHVLFFEEKFLGYYYIMVMTPYPFSNNAYENPSVLGSQDGVIWEVPEGIINPVVGTPPDVRRGGYFSDPFIFRNGDKLELWFRRTLARNDDDRRVRPRNSHNRIYRTVSYDLINWSTPEIVKDCPNDHGHFMSKVVMFDGTRHRLWYSNFFSQLFHMESYDLVNWTERQQVMANLNGLGIWHQEIRFTGRRYEALFTSADWDNRPVFRLFFATSYDGLNFKEGREISLDRISPDLDGKTVYKCSFVNVNGVYRMYFSVFNSRRRWELFYFEIAEENVYRLFD